MAGLVGLLGVLTLGRKAPFDIDKGEIKFYRYVNESTIGELIKYKENKSLDLLIYNSLPLKNREWYVSFIQREKPSDDQAAINTRDNKNMMDGLFLLYCITGSFKLLITSDKKIIPKNILRATNRNSQDFTLEKVSSLRHGHQFKCVYYLKLFPEKVLTYPDWFKQTVCLTFAGHRLFSIIKVMSPWLNKANNLDPSIKILLSKVDDAPFLSFHPDHPDNPMENCDVWVCAYLGDTVGSIVLENLINDHQALFAPSLRDAFRTKLNSLVPKFPNLTKVAVACDNRYSISLMFRPNTHLLPE